MIRFECDYAEGCHPKILGAFVRTNEEQLEGYCLDEHCNKARELIKKICQAPDARVYFVSGGTQANKVVMAQLLRPHQGVVSTNQGHVSIHEAGAIESSGHKVLALESTDGKLSAKALKDYLTWYWADESYEHIVQPAMVYISLPTELGTSYSKAELTAISKICKEYKIPLFLDGARLGYGLASPVNDLTYKDIAELTDVFYIGGTKVGALIGEAIVFTGSKQLDKDFRSVIKQNGALLAKGRAIGVQFETLFSPASESDSEVLYNSISQNAIKQAMIIKKAFADKGFRFWVDSPTNQQFPILTKKAVDQLQKKGFCFMVWRAKSDNEIITRFATSWMTRDEDVKKLREAILAL